MFAYARRQLMFGYILVCVSNSLGCLVVSAWDGRGETYNSRVPTPGMDIYPYSI